VLPSASAEHSLLFNFVTSSDVYFRFLSGCVFLSFKFIDPAVPSEVSIMEVIGCEGVLSDGVDGNFSFIFAALALAAVSP